MSMLDSLRSKLGIDPDADSYVDDTEENVFPGGRPALRTSSTPSIRWC